MTTPVPASLLRIVFVRRLAATAVALACISEPAAAGECDLDWSSVGNDAADMMAAPFHMDQQAALTTLGAGLVIGASFVWWDDDVDRVVRDRPDSFPYSVAHQVSRLASWYGASDLHAFITLTTVTGAIAVGGAIADDDYVLQTSAIMAESIAFTVGLTEAIKIVAGRARPNAGQGPHSFDVFASPMRGNRMSFPSGHSSGAFAMAGAAAGRHPHWYVEVPSYLFAVSAALQRVDTRAHWTSDVIAGGFLGYAVAEFLVDRHTCPEDTGDEGSSGATVSLTFQF